MLCSLAVRTAHKDCESQYCMPDLRVVLAQSNQIFVNAECIQGHWQFYQMEIRQRWFAGIKQRHCLVMNLLPASPYLHGQRPVRFCTDRSACPVRAWTQSLLGQHLALFRLLQGLFTQGSYCSIRAVIWLPVVEAPSVKAYKDSRLQKATSGMQSSS